RVDRSAKTFTRQRKAEHFLFSTIAAFGSGRGSQRLAVAPAETSVERQSHWHAGLRSKRESATATAATRKPVNGTPRQSGTAVDSRPTQPAQPALGQGA